MLILFVNRGHRGKIDHRHAPPEPADQSVRVHGEILPQPSRGGRDVQLHARLVHALELQRKHKLQRLERYVFLFLHFCSPSSDWVQCSMAVFLLCGLIKVYRAVYHPRGATTGLVPTFLASPLSGNIRSPRRITSCQIITNLCLCVYVNHLYLHQPPFERKQPALFMYLFIYLLIY